MKRFLQALLLWAMGAANAFAGGTIDLTNGTGTGDGWSLENNVFTITNGANVTVSGTTTTYRIVVATGATAHITLSNASITASAAFDMSGATVTLTLSGASHLFSTNAASAGIYVSTTSTLTINSANGVGSTDGTLNVWGGDRAAGIGGNQNQNAGVITINGGTINATGGATNTSHQLNATGGGAGIGGGYETNGGTLTINGGKVTARTDSND